MTWKPDVTVAAVVERAGRFLMVEERIRSRLVFNQPAGHLEPGESLLQAVIRETVEETGWSFVPEAVVGVYLWGQSAKTSDARPRTFLRVAFRGDVHLHDPLRPLDTGIERAVWLTRQQLAAQQGKLRSPLVMRCIDDYVAGRRFPLDLLSHLVNDAESALSSLNSQAS